MRILRRYRCAACGHRCSRTFVVSDPADIQDPPCPACASVNAPPPDRVAAPRIVTTKSRAVDEAWKIAQEDYGFTDMNDGSHEGDIAFKPPPPPPSTADPRTVTRPAMLWGGASPASSPMQLPGAANLLGTARLSSAVANREDRNPLRLLHRHRPRLQAIPVNRG